MTVNDLVVMVTFNAWFWFLGFLAGQHSSRGK